ncbi:MAG: hypothetical protein WB760_22190 [Xanthobacteraceae bacterium]
MLALLTRLPLTVLLATTEMVPLLLLVMPAPAVRLLPVPPTAIVPLLFKAPVKFAVALLSSWNVPLLVSDELPVITPLEPMARVPAATDVAPV